MLKETSNNNNKNIFSETTSIEKEKMICKDGFCSLPVSYTHLRAHET